MNIIYNNEEHRFRAGVRLLLFLALAFFLAIPSGFFASTVWSYIALSIGLFIATLLMIKQVDRRSIKEIGLKLEALWWKELGLGILIAVLALTVVFLLEWGMGWIEISGYGWQRAGSDYWLLTLAVYMVQMMGVGFYEELIFRGYFIPNLKEGAIIGSITPWQATLGAVFITSAIFGIAHIWNPNATLISTSYILIAGIMLTIPYLITGRLALSIGIHFAWNFAMGGIFGLPVSGLEMRRSLIQVEEVGPDLWTGGSFGPEAGIIGLVGMLIIILLVFGYGRVIKKEQPLVEPIFKRDYVPLEMPEEGK
jgi:hypothetical protein